MLTSFLLLDAGLSVVLDNFAHAPVLFFFLGLLAVLFKSDLDIPEPIAKFLGIYLLFHIGIDGGRELAHSGFSSQLFWIMASCMAVSFAIPFVLFKILKLKLNAYDAGAIAATYGSVSAVTFATASSFLQSMGIKFGGYMVASMALMESPAIIAGLILVRLYSKPAETPEQVALKTATASNRKHNWGKVLHEALFNGSVFLLLGSLFIGFIICTSKTGEKEILPFVDDIFKGMLSLYMLDMGLLAARRLGELRKTGAFLIIFALLYPLVGAALGIGTAYLLDLHHGDALLMTVLFASASYIAVPTAMRLSVPEANVSLMLPMALGVTFTFNISVGIPIYHSVLEYLGFIHDVAAPIVAGSGH